MVSAQHQSQILLTLLRLKENLSEKLPLPPTGDDIFGVLIHPLLISTIHAHILLRGREDMSLSLYEINDLLMFECDFYV